MSRVLVVWELGGGMGHLTGVASLAARLAGRGHAVTLAVPDPEAGRRALHGRLAAGHSVDVVRGAGWRALKEVNGTPAGQVPTLTLADVMLLFGWDRAERIGPAVKFWRQLIDRLQPDLVFADFAPTLRLGCQDWVRTVMLGTGYSMPPAGRLLPPVRPWHTEVTAYSRMNEGHILAAFNRLRHALKLPAVDFFADVFHGDVSCPCTLPLLDPYAAYRSQTPLPPHNIEPIEPGPAPAQRPRRALVHLPADHPRLSAILRALVDRGLVPEVVLRGGTRALPVDCPDEVVVHPDYLDLGEHLPHVRLLVHHGGLGLAYAAAMAGTPQYIFSKNLEHQITGQALVSQGVAVSHRRQDASDPDLIAHDIGTLLRDETCRRACELAAAVPRTGGAAVLDRIAAIAETHEGTTS